MGSRRRRCWSDSRLLTKEKREDLGVADYYNNNTSGEEALAPPSLRGVSMMRLSFLDGRLYYIVITYSEYEPASVAYFVRQAATTMRLPSRG